MVAFLLGRAVPAVPYIMRTVRRIKIVDNYVDIFFFCGYLFVFLWITCG